MLKKQEVKVEYDRVIHISERSLYQEEEQGNTWNCVKSKMLTLKRSEMLSLFTFWFVIEFMTNICITYNLIITKHVRTY